MSKDDTTSIASKYPLRIIYEQKKGRGAAYNSGLVESKGKYIAFLDSDAIAPEDWIEKAVNLLEQNPKAAVVFFKNLAPKSSSYFQKCVDTLLCKGSGQANGAVYRKTALNAVNGFNISMIYLQENDANLKLKKNGYSIIFDSNLKILHFPRKTFTKFVYQCAEAGIGSIQLIKSQKAFSEVANVLQATLVTLFPLITLVGFFNSLTFGVFLLSLNALFFGSYCAFLWVSTDRIYRKTKFVIPASFLMWVSYLGNIIGYAIWVKRYLGNK